jgi:uncharacterized membrane protein YedE/YeeE
MITCIVALSAGIAMGALIQLVKASDPAVITRNLRLEDLSIIKFMGVTIAVGMALVYTIALVSPVHFGIKPVYGIGVLLGGLIFGVGFGLGGYCPGTCVVAAGEWRKDALWAILGGVFGTLIFTLVYSSVVAPVNGLLNFGKLTLPQALHLPEWPTAIAISVIFAAVIAFIPTEPGAGTKSPRQ